MSWTWPVDNHDITQAFGPSHAGVDIGAPQGSPLRAPVGGQVEKAQGGWNDGYGNLVVLRTPEGLRVFLAHLSTILTKPDATVSPGQVIGTTGTTGNSTGPHLHLEVRNTGNRAISPMEFFVDDPTATATAGASAASQGVLGSFVQPQREGNTGLELLNTPLGSINLGQAFQDRLAGMGLAWFGLLLLFASLVALITQRQQRERERQLKALEKAAPALAVVNPAAGIGASLIASKSKSAAVTRGARLLAAQAKAKKEAGNAAG